jgi:hypothetical protein
MGVEPRTEDAALELAMRKRVAKRPIKIRNEKRTKGTYRTWVVENGGCSSGGHRIMSTGMDRVGSERWVSAAQPFAIGGDMAAALVS